MRISVAAMYPGVDNALQDRKRKREDLSPASEQHLVPARHLVDSACTSFIPEDLHPKRQHLLGQGPHPWQIMSTGSTSQRQSLSGSIISSQPSEQTDLDMTASDGYSTSNSISKQPEVTVMEEDQQSIAPAHQQQHQNPPRGPGMSHSSSAPDLRLTLATELPDNRPMFLPVPGSYAGALVPYKSPEVQPDSPRNSLASRQQCLLQQTIAEAHQRVTSDLINHMVDEFNCAQAHQGLDNEEASAGRVAEMAPAADGQAPAVHIPLQHDGGGVLDPHTRKRKVQKLPICPSKWARTLSSQDCMLLGSDCDVEMEDA